MRFRFSRRAEADIEDIGAYIAQDNPRRAAAFVRELRDRCRQLITRPEAFPLRAELGDGVRMLVFGNYLVFYVVHADLLEIRRVLHGACDLRGLRV